MSASVASIKAMEAGNYEMRFTGKTSKTDGSSLISRPTFTGI